MPLSHTPATQELITQTQLLIQLGIVLGVYCVVAFFFIRSINKTTKHLPVHLPGFSPWLAWLLFIPGLSYLVAWFLLPFAIPRLLKEVLRLHGTEALKRCKHLRRFGLMGGIFSLFFFLGLGYLSYLSKLDMANKAFLASSVLALCAVVILFVSLLVIFILYWLTLVRIKQNLIERQRFDKQSADKH